MEEKLVDIDFRFLFPRQTGKTSFYIPKDVLYLMDINRRYSKILQGKYVLRDYKSEIINLINEYLQNNNEEAGLNAA